VTVRIGFIGAGGIASVHMSTLQAVEGAQIVAVADVNSDRAEAAASRFIANAYNDPHDMLEREKLDAIYVCVPPFAHNDYELIAAKKGIHLFVEKPLALELAAAKEVAVAAKTSGIVTAVGYHWRYSSHTETAREKLKGKQVGMVLGYWMGGFPEVGWWRRMEQSGGQMVEQATHIFDLVRYLIGEIKEVYAVYANRDSKRIPGFNIYDVGTAAVKFANGVVGTISNTCLLSVPYTVGLHIVARDLVIEIHGDLRIIEPGHTEIFTGGQNPMLAESEAFIKAIKTGDSTGIRSTYEDALKTLAVTLACNESAASGKPVEVQS